MGVRKRGDMGVRRREEKEGGQEGRQEGRGRKEDE